jgi:hypothetical protein
LGERSTRYPLSLKALSVQDRLTDEADAAVAVSPEGAIGTGFGVVALAVFETLSPAVLNAATR